MTAEGKARVRRAIDHPVAVLIRQLGFPIVMALLMWSRWGEEIQAERQASARREERLVLVIDRLNSSIDANTEAARSTGAELGRLAERVRILEEMGSRAMTARGLQPQQPHRRDPP